MSDAAHRPILWLRLPIDVIRILLGRHDANEGIVDAGPTSRPPEKFDLVAIALTPNETVSDRWRLVRPHVASRRLGRILNVDEFESGAWRTREALARYLTPELSELGPDLPHQAELLMEGKFRPSPAFDWVDIELPPEWHRKVVPGRTWDFYKHSLQWVHSLLDRGFEDGDGEAVDLVVSIIKSWISSNSAPPGASEGAWYDHAVALRLRMFSRFWDLYRRSSLLDEEIVPLFFASVYQHALFACDPSNFNERSNHGLEITMSLFAVAMSFPEFRETEAWLALAHRRLDQYVDVAFSEAGVNREQSPSYHFFVLQRLAHLASFLEANGVGVAESVTRTLDKGIGAGLHILRRDYSMPAFGDSTRVLNRNWKRDLDELARLSDQRAAADVSANPRDDGASLFVSFDAGYAIFRGASPGVRGQSDIHLAFKCNYFEFPHYHRDGGSVILYYLGREWIVDAGTYGADWERPERRYVRSARAHNVVLVNGEEFEDWPMELLCVDRTDTSDNVKVRHHLRGAVHDRTVSFTPPDQVTLTDTVESTSGASATYQHLLHLPPDVELVELDPLAVEMRHEKGSCLVRYVGQGRLSIVSGVDTPELQGWISPERGEFIPAPVLVWETEGSYVEWQVDINVSARQ